MSGTDPLAPFSAPTRAWFAEAFAEPTRAQVLGWAAVSAGRHTLLHALPGAVDRLRAAREKDLEGGPEIVILAAADPAQPYGASLPWPRDGESERLLLARVPGAYLVTADGTPALYVERGGRGLVTLPALADKEIASLALAALPRLLAPSGPLKELRLERVDRAPPGESVMAEALRSVGFRPSYRAGCCDPDLAGGGAPENGHEKCPGGTSPRPLDAISGPWSGSSGTKRTVGVAANPA